MELEDRAVGSVGGRGRGRHGLVNTPHLPPPPTVLVHPDSKPCKPSLLVPNMQVVLQAPFTDLGEVLSDSPMSQRERAVSTSILVMLI